MAKIASSAIPNLKAQIDDYTSKENNAPGAVYFAVNKKGELIFEHASGKAGVGVDKPMTTDSVLWIASCTKMITGLACMQLVEQGKLALDDVDLVEKIAPELKAVQVLEDGKLVPKKQGITLRMLLSHTAGFGYSFFNTKLNEHYLPTGVDELCGKLPDVLGQPLVNQPGSRWEYGINIDWAGILLERVTGQSLNDYFQEHIFKPMGITHINMFPSEEMKKDLVYLNQRDASGKLAVRSSGHMLQRPLQVSSEDEKKEILNSGGAGCFARPSQYCQIIATLLNDGTHPGSGNQILKPETVKEMFTNQIPEFPDFARTPIIAPKKDYSNDLPELYGLDPPDTPQGWGLTFFLHVKDSAVHSEGTGWWAGLPNLFWWADRQRGIGGIIGTQVVPFGDPGIIGLWATIEGAIAQNLE